MELIDADKNFCIPLDGIKYIYKKRKEEKRLLHRDRSFVKEIKKI